MTDPDSQVISGEDLVEHPSIKAPSTNPFAQSANITLSIPESVDVKLVDASALADYEVWVLLTSILSSAVTGFLVALIQASGEERGRYIATTAIFVIMMLVSIWMAHYKRKKLSSKARKIRFRVGEQLVDD
jgi:hypothetical protein